MSYAYMFRLLEDFVALLCFYPHPRYYRRTLVVPREDLHFVLLSVILLLVVELVSPPFSWFILC